ncbi:hypothetical protein Syun_000532 [Stephania yunnanensis]|uniref:Uncharacterized protein n=1 Tax=Stephania yunnanensis TaxID=152371 RepID=A0AAP0LDV0_9MAGN
MNEMNKNMERMMEIMQSLSMSAVKAPQVFEALEISSSNLQNYNTEVVDQTPFKVEAKTEIHVYNGDLDAEQLDAWLTSLEIYLSTKMYYDLEKVNFAKLRFGEHALGEKHIP